MFTLSPTKDLLIILVIVLLIFGPKRLPGLGRQLGQGIREFKDSVTGGHDDGEEERERPQLSQAAAPVAPSTVSTEQRPAEPAQAEPRS